MIHNVLLEEAKKQYRIEKYEMMAKELESKIEKEGSSTYNITESTAASSSSSEPSTSEPCSEINVEKKEKD